MNIVMLGLNDPAGMMIAFANAINRYTEHRARVLSLRTLYNVQFEYDIELPRLAEYEFDEIDAILKEADIFHFHMLMDENYQLGPFNLWEYAKGKQLLHHHHGTYDHQVFLNTAADYREKYKRLGRKVLVSTPDLLEFLPDATWQPNLVPISDPAYLPRKNHLPLQDEIRLVQAPTRTWDKHTVVFKNVTARLARKYPNICSQILQNMSHRECLKRKRSAHAVFDHMNGWFGISSLESLSQGVPVIAGLSPMVKEHIAAFTGTTSLPWVLAHNEAELENVLEELILSPERRVAIGNESRKFMETYWTEKHALASLLRIYQS